MHVDPKIRMTSNRLQPIFATLGDLPGPCSALPSPIGRTKVDPGKQTLWQVGLNI